MLWLRSVELSRRDKTLLAVDFNLRNAQHKPSPKSRSDDTFSHSIVPAGLCRDGMHPVSTVRRLKPTVNKMPSLRDFPFTLLDLERCNLQKKTVICFLFFIPKMFSFQIFEIKFWSFCWDKNNYILEYKYINNIIVELERGWFFFPWSLVFKRCALPSSLLWLVNGGSWIRCRDTLIYFFIHNFFFWSFNQKKM